MEGFWGTPISVYTRAMAIEDGTLVDLTDVAKEEGFRWPVAITSTAFGQIEPGKEAAAGQDLRGRLHDLFFMLSRAIKKTPHGASEIRFSVIISDSKPWHLNLKAVCGAGDDLEQQPVITLMLPEED